MGNTSAFIIIISSMIYNLEYVNLGNHLREFDINPTERPLENLRRLRAVRNLLWKTTYGFSKCLSLPILFAVANLCFDAIIGVYYSIARVLNSPDPELSLEAVNGFFWASVQICPIVFLSIAVKRLITEISETSFAIYRIYAIFSEDGECSENENVMCWIQEFSLELFHKQIPFTAYGLFPLDCTLLFSVISTLVTYEIIAVQFKSTDSEELTPNISRIISPESS
ncbi:putative gustatory receptor 2a [Fopius arisanus]|uniref:Gustatory receptor 2a n=1 Tax=Fopius arisanus TaxID=64838 RepID=A0A9R1UB40_9HYME|nr:PREDICTED: putative gustatory receptor 2a [Fopius arisanus]